MTEDPDFGIELRAGDATVTLAVRGDIDIATVAELEEARSRALAESPRKVLIDLGEVGFVDSSGVKFLIDTLRLSQQDGWELVLKPPGDDVMKVFTVIGAERYLPFADGRDG